MPSFYGASMGPNVLWIQTDEQRPDSLGCYGSAWARTPNVDELARRGTVFHECHVQSPMCVSSRTSMLTALYPPETGVFSNAVQGAEDVLPPTLKTVPNVFADAGYSTISLGKWHTPVHPTWQEVDAFIGFPDVAGPAAVMPPFTDEAQQVIKNPGSFMDTVDIPIIIGGIYPYHDWGDDPAKHLTELALTRLRHAAASDEQFFLRVSYVWPHTPVLAPRPWDRFYDPDEVKCDALNQKGHDGRAKYDRWLAGVEKGMELPIDQWRQAAAHYYALCSYVDHEVGRLMIALEELGLAENTIVAYNADHGRAMGEFGHCQKGTFDYEVWRVPFIVTWPGHVPAGEHRRDLCELMDFGPTLFTLAGVEPAVGMGGRDLFDSSQPPPAAVFGAVDMFSPRRVGVRTDRYRYDCTYALDQVKCDPGNVDANLIDLQSDPSETENLARDPSMKDLADEHYQLISDWMSRPKRF